ncbi:MAG: type II toxin-antitoxin system RelE/ParE family toxin [Salegentibacter sp.]
MEDTIVYLDKNWTDKELKNFFLEVDHTIQLISKNPFLFQASERNRSIRRVIIAQYSSLYYRLNDEVIEILSFFSNRQDPQKNKYE